MLRLFSTAVKETSRIQMLRRSIREMEQKLINSPYKYKIKPLRYDGTETELVAELERMKQEMAKHANPLWKNSTKQLY